MSSASIEAGNVCIVGMGSYAPEKVLTNHDLEKMMDTSDEWIRTRTGIGSRHIAKEGEVTSDLATEAARRALEDAGRTPEDVDAVIICTVTPDMFFPNTACRVQDNLGIPKTSMCLDLSAACSGFLYGLEVGRGLFSNGVVETVLVVGAEKFSTAVDWEDRNTCVLFGDAAGAAVLEIREGRRGIMGSAVGCNGKLGDLLEFPGGGSKNPATHETVDEKLHCIRMEGRKVFKHAVKAMVDAGVTALERAGLTLDDVGCIIPHQANMRIIEAVAQRLNVPMERLFNNLEEYGNTSAATIPLALDEARRKGRVKAGDVVLLTAFGGGFTWGSIVLEM
jgi:3-oxoacyl-[acyl-carrier-protein] synthase-3